MTPYIIGFKLTIDGWRDNRLASGWKMKEAPKMTPSRNNGDGGASNEILKMEAVLGDWRENLGLVSRHLEPPK
jgi:hypothetical protein